MPQIVAVRLLAFLAFLIGFGLPISTAADNLAAGLFLIVWLITGDWRNRWQRLRANPVSWAVGGLLLLAALGCSWSMGSGQETLRYFSKYASLLLALALLSVSFEAKLRSSVLLGFASAALLTAVLSFAFKFGLLPLSWFPDRSPSNPVLFKLHITHGFFIAIGAYFWWVQAWEFENPRWRFVYLVAALVTAANVLVVEGRTGYVVLASLLIYLFVQRYRWRGALLSVGLLVGLVLLASQFPESAGSRRFALAIEELQAWWHNAAVDEGSSMGLRMQFAINSLRLIAEHPWIGVGTGGYEAAYRALVPAGSVIANNPHNQYLLTTAQFGLLGFLLLAGMFVVLWRATQAMSDRDRLQARGFLIAYLVGNLFNSFLYDHAEAHLFAWGIGLMFYRATPTKSLN